MENAEIKQAEEVQTTQAAAVPEVAPESEPEPEYVDVTIDDFSKCDICVCKVLACDAVPKSKKLLRFDLDDGSGTPRQILSGIHAFYEPEELVGKTILAIINLPVRKMMGLESHGMILSAVKEMEDGSERLHLVMLDDAIPAGDRIC